MFVSLRLLLIAVVLLLPVNAPSTAQISSQSSEPSAPPLALTEIPIFVYHHIDNHTSPWDVRTARFEEQLTYLMENDYQTISMEAYSNAIQNGEALPAKPVILTFDDGFDDAYNVAFPLLKQYGMTGTFYVITGRVGQPGYLTWDQITEMHAAGMEIGGHTIHHPFLTQLPTLDAFREILGSRLDLEAHLKSPVTTFAYPYNDHNFQTVAMAALAGYRSACIVDMHTGDQIFTPYRIPRNTVTPGESMSVFELVAHRGYRGHQPPPENVAKIGTPIAPVATSAK
ncbi:MAG: polysaccharide deacetylase family protein [Chloroflexota bacterium]